MGEAQRGEYLHQQLDRWWQLTAQAALAQPEAFDLWRLVRTTPRAAVPHEALLGPFAAVPALVEEAFGRSPWHAQKGLPLSVLTASLAGQWTAVVDVVLNNEACRADKALTTRVLQQAYTGWWQSLGLPTYLEAAWQAVPVARRPKPVAETPVWAQVLLHVLAPATPTPPLPGGQPLGQRPPRPLLPTSTDESKA